MLTIALSLAAGAAGMAAAVRYSRRVRAAITPAGLAGGNGDTP